MPADLQLLKIWEHSTFAAGYLGDAIKARREDRTQDVTKELGNALILLNKATAEIQQHLSNRDHQ